MELELREIKRALWLVVLYLILLLMASCGPVVYTSASPGPPPPSWFYPNRVEVVRYVYFPELRLYFDFYSNTYLVLEQGVWVRHKTLPPRYRSYDLNRYRYRRIPGYRSDDINPYDREQRRNSGRSNKDYNRRGYF